MTRRQNIEHKNRCNPNFHKFSISKTRHITSHSVDSYHYAVTRYVVYPQALCEREIYSKGIWIRSTYHFVKKIILSTFLKDEYLQLFDWNYLVFCCHHSPYAERRGPILNPPQIRDDDDDYDSVHRAQRYSTFSIGVRMTRRQNIEHSNRCNPIFQNSQSRKHVALHTISMISISMQ